MEDQKIVVYEIQNKDIFPKMIVGAGGLLGVLGVSFFLYQQTPTVEVFISLLLATIAFGVALLMTWRKKGEYEIIEIKNGVVSIVHSHLTYPSYEAPLENTKFQRLRLPNGTIQLYMRDGQRAVEVAKTLPQKQRDILAEKIEMALDPAG